MPHRIDQNEVAAVIGSGYPTPFDAPCATRVRRRLGDAAGLSDFGVNLLRLPPGSWSSQRHCHTREDEFVFVLEGEVVLVTNTGEEILRPGDSAGFKPGPQDAHHLQNRSPRDAVLLEVGSRKPQEDEAYYPDIDLHVSLAGGFTHRDGQPYPKR